MGESVKNKVFSGVIWSAIERFSVQGVNFVLNLIIARMLLPSDYGLIAMLSIFIALSQNLTEAGLGYALIQKIDRTQKDISTAFYYNIFVSGLIYLILYISAPYIADFYETPKLTLITRVVSVSIIINSLGMVK